MQELSQALARAARTMMHPRMLWLMIWPLALSLIVWIVFGTLFGAQVFNWVESYLNQSSLYKSVTGTWPISVLATGLLWLLMFLLAIPLVLVTATLIVGLVAMPMVVRFVADRDFSALERRRGGTFVGSLVNTVVSLLLFILLALVTLPLWLIPPLWPVIPIVLLGFFNQRVFRYDALADHGSPEEIRTIVKGERRWLWSLGMILGLIGYIPFAGLFAPVYSALAFTYYCLGRLSQMRGIQMRGIDSVRARRLR